jgi:hypothetical protein
MAYMGLAILTMAYKECNISNVKVFMVLTCKQELMIIRFIIKSHD